MTEAILRPQKTVLISGGSGGIGAAAARLAGAAGWRVVVGYATGEAKAKSLCREIVAIGGEATIAALPLNDEETLKQSISALRDSVQTLDALVMCASPPPHVASFLKTRAEHYRAQLETTVIGHHLLLSEIWKAFFRPSRCGHVVALLTNALGPPPAANMASYVVAKAALKALLQTALGEFGAFGLRVSTLSPGYTRTAMLDAFPPQILQAAETTGTAFHLPEEVARAVMLALDSPPPAGEMRECFPGWN